MTPAELEKWASKQIAAAVAIGVNPLDAANSTRAFLALLPAGTDPDTYVPPAYALQQDVTSPAVLADARADWYSKVEPRYARLLDAKAI